MVFPLGWLPCFAFVFYLGFYSYVNDLVNFCKGAVDLCFGLPLKEGSVSAVAKGRRDVLWVLFPREEGLW